MWLVEELQSEIVRRAVLHVNPP
jgi:hypothetical protein